ncbi:hypothetical protein FOWG_18275 [Fusarium oxysporum f. sp. lycopersici MN25]|nr:hypothetical protein FOWG_18275 [Fusarium oxysporum f. sp. lycopersici MN25]
MISMGRPNNRLSRNSIKSNILHFLRIFWSQSSRFRNSQFQHGRPSSLC